MKKAMTKIVSAFLLLSVLFSIFSGFTAFANEADRSCLEHYFTSIEGSVPKNVKGSCAYVALSLMLLFYDSYWNDSFIEDKFESDTFVRCYSHIRYPNGAPKLKLENTIIPRGDDGNYDLSAYAGFVNENANDYLHLYLVSLAAKDVLGDTGHPLIDLQDETYGINIDESKKLLEYYLYDICGFTIDQISVHTEISEGLITQDSEIYKTMVEKVSAGIPVYYSADSADGGHAMVAYSFTGENICLHTGYTTESYATVLGTVYNTDVRIMWIEINDSLPHSCNEKYRFGFDEIPVCSCIAYKDVHPEHVHSKFYISNDEATHTYGCEWGCDDIVSPHEYASYTSYSNSLHSARCRCGYTMAESHNFERISPRYSVCMNCGYTRDHHLGGNENVHLGTEDEEDTE